MSVLSASLKKYSMLIAGCGLAISVSACSTTPVVKHTKAAPITYKVGQGVAKYASVTMPSRATPSPYGASRSTSPQVSAPQVHVPQVAMPAPIRPAAPVFEQSRVDRDLYKHQKVGKRYSIMGKSYTPKHNPGYNVVGIASWYGDKFHGKPTATGEIYNKNDLTAAHKTLPLNSMLYVTNLENGRTLLVRLNDRGPFVGDRIIDLSEAAANALGTRGKGLGKVRVQYAGPADPMAPKRRVPAPQPRYEEAPMIAQAPRPTPRPAPQYQPLRQQPTPRNTPMAEAPAPYIAPVPQVEIPRVAAPIVPQAPIAAMPAPQPEDGGQVTLTIKGPIHVAGHDATAPQPRFIRGVIKTK